MQQNVSLAALDKNNDAHLSIMYTVRTHPEVDRHLRGSPPANFDTHVNYLKKVGPHKRFYVVQFENALCGYCQLTLSDAHVEIGMALHPDFCNKGIGSKAMSQLLEILQGDVETSPKPVILYVKNDNPRAIALYQKHHFKCEGAVNEYGEYLMKKSPAS